MSPFIGIFVICLMCIQERHAVTNVCETQAKPEPKRSLSLVFDLTFSMSSNHAKIRKVSNSISNTLKSYDDSLIENYIITTYNDAVAKVSLNTQSLLIFEHYLSLVNPSSEWGDYKHGSSMDAVQMALEVSHPSSHIYLFTDEGTVSKADLLETVKSLAIKKKSQVDVVVTCYYDCVDKSYIPLIKATDGKLFVITPEDYLAFFKYIADSNKSKRTILVDKELAPGHNVVTHEFDSTAEDVTIGVFRRWGSTARIEVLKPDGSKADIEDTVMNIYLYKVFKISTNPPGKYTIIVYSDKPATLTITAKTTLIFSHGFSRIKPASMKVTSAQPIQGKTSNIAVQLETPDENIELDSINIVDLDGNVINNFEAKVLHDDGCTKTYYASPFTPTNLFKIAIIAHNTKTNETITRYSKPIEPQVPEPAKALSPTVEILEGPKVVASYKKPLQLTCKITGYPVPSVVWENVELGTKINSSLLELELPYVYVSNLYLPSIETDAKYRCKASTGSIDNVEVCINKFFEIEELPKDVYEIKYNDAATIPCKVRAIPPANVTWHFKDKILRNNENILVYDDKLIFNHMQPNMVGSYSCEVRNAFENSKTDFDVYITGFERPVIRKDISAVSVLQGTKFNFTCYLTAGMPEPAFNWTWKHLNDSAVNYKLQDGNQTFVIDNVSKELGGSVIICEASNVAGSDFHIVSLNVEYKPTIQSENNSIMAVEGTIANLDCFVYGHPKPLVAWSYNGHPVLADETHTIARNNQLKIKASLDNSGKYTCEAKNKHGAASQTIDVQFAAPVSIEIPERSYGVLVGNNITLSCRTVGYPKPAIKWIFRNLTSQTTIQNDISGSVSLTNMRLSDDGTYICVASNLLGSKNITYKVHMQEIPKIKNGVSTVYAIQGTEATLNCNLVAGTPKPEMRWTWTNKRKNLEDKLGYKDAKTKITIKNVKKEYSGIYICMAWNEVGFDFHKITLDVQYAPEFKKGNKTVIAIEGTTTTLDCPVDGHPTPAVTWSYNGKLVVENKGHTINSKNQLKFESSLANSGKYTCEAKNKHGTAKQSFEVEYAVPVRIETPVNRTFNVTVGKGIELPCNSSGYPQPTIRWIFKDSLTASSQKIYKSFKNGSLSLKNVNVSADGEYTCVANNIAGAVDVTYRVNVHYPAKIVNMHILAITRAVEGDRFLRLPCKVQGNPKPVISWRLRGTDISKDSPTHDIESNGTLVIKNVDITSRGYHQCEATNYLGSDQKQVYVDVTRFPKYKDPPVSSVNLYLGQKAELECPLPLQNKSLLRWYKTGVFITEGILTIPHATFKDSGMYTCWIDLESSKTANVNVTVDLELDYQEDVQIDPVVEKLDSAKWKDCTLHLQDDFIGNTPFISYDSTIKTVGDYMHILKDSQLTLSCSRAFTNIPKSEITATCKGGSHFEVDEELYKYSDLKCTTNMMFKIERKGFHCGHKDSETADIGFMVGGSFSPIFEVCYNKKKYTPFYTKLTLRPTFSGLMPKDSEWSNYDLLPYAKEDEKCDDQKFKISTSLRRWFHRNDTCCFSKRQLVSAKDVMPGFSQTVTFNNLNVVPQWGCISENWNEMEYRVRSLAKAVNHDLLVWTGQASQLSLPSDTGNMEDITINNGMQQIPVPKYMWKVVQDLKAQSSVAIIQVNIPDLTPEEAFKHVRCSDVCDRVAWMAGGSWTDVSKGYIYCCRLWEFETAFGYRNKFNRNHKLLITDEY